MKLASGIAPIWDYLDRDINVALGNDGRPVTTPSIRSRKCDRRASCRRWIGSIRPPLLPARYSKWPQ